MLKRFFRNYLSRHRDPVNIVLHVVGLPLTFVAPVVWLMNGGELVSAWSLFLTGYALQFTGHAWEGNDPGEVIVVRKMRGIPFVEVAPQKPDEATQFSNKFAAASDDRPNDQ